MKDNSSSKERHIFNWLSTWLDQEKEMNSRASILWSTIGKRGWRRERWQTRNGREWMRLGKPAQVHNIHTQRAQSVYSSGSTVLLDSFSVEVITTNCFPGLVSWFVPFCYHSLLLFLTYHSIFCPFVHPPFLSTCFSCPFFFLRSCPSVHIHLAWHDLATTLLIKTATWEGQEEKMQMMLKEKEKREEREIVARFTLLLKFERKYI